MLVRLFNPFRSQLLRKGLNPRSVVSQNQNPIWSSSESHSILSSNPPLRQRSTMPMIGQKNGESTNVIGANANEEKKYLLSIVAKLAKFEGGGKIDSIEDLEREIVKLDLSQVVQLFHYMANRKLKHSERIYRLVDFLPINSLNPKELLSLIWSISHMNVKCPAPLLAKLVKAITFYVDELSPRDICKLYMAFSRIGYKSEQLFMKIHSFDLKHFALSDLTLLLFSISKTSSLSDLDRKLLFFKVFAQIDSQIENSTSVDLLLIILSLNIYSWYHPYLFEKLSDLFLKNVSNLSTKSLSEGALFFSSIDFQNKISHKVKLKSEDQDPSFMEFVDKVNSTKLDISAANIKRINILKSIEIEVKKSFYKAKPRELSRLLASFTKQNFDSIDFQDLIIQKLCEQFPQLNPDELLEVTSELSKFGDFTSPKLSELYDQIHNVIEPKVPFFNSITLSKIANSCALILPNTSNYYPLFNAIETRTINQLQSLSHKNLCQLLAVFSLSNTNRASRRLFLAVGNFIEEHFQSFQIEDLDQILSSFSQAGFLHDPLAFRAYKVTFSTRKHSSHLYPTLFYSLTNLGFDPTGLTNSLIEYFDKRKTFSDYEFPQIASFIWSLTCLNKRKTQLFFDLVKFASTFDLNEHDFPISSLFRLYWTCLLCSDSPKQQQLTKDLKEKVSNYISQNSLSFKAKNENPDSPLFQLKLDLQKILNHLKMKSKIHYYDKNAIQIDLAIEEQKIAIFLLPWKAYSRDLLSSKRSPRLESLTLYKILKLDGWRIVIVPVQEWSKTTTSDQKISLLKKCFENVNIEI